MRSETEGSSTWDAGTETEQDVKIVQKHAHDYRWLKILKEMQICVDTTMNLRIECEVSLSFTVVVF